MSYEPNSIKKLFHHGRRLLAKSWLSLLSVTQIAITGSQGKTNTSSTLFHVLNSLAPTIRTDLNLDTTYNIPITALKIAPWIKYAIFELGVDHYGEMDQHLEIVKPKIAIITGISPVHTDKEHLGSFENLIKEKQKLIEALPANGFAILNGDDENVRKMEPFTKAKVIFYGKNENNNIRAVHISLSLEGTTLTIINEIFKIPLIGKHNIYNVLSSYAVCKILGILNVETFRHSLTELRSLSGRMSLEKGPLNTLLIDDSLRANPASTTSGLQTLSEIEYTKGKKIAILAEMGELEHPEVEHTKIGELIAKLKIDKVVVIGPLHKNTIQSALKNGYKKENIFYSENVIQAADILKKIINDNDLLYLKGSLLRKVRRIIMILNEIKVGCNITLCPFYFQCPGCKYLEKGYHPTHS